MKKQFFRPLLYTTVGAAVLAMSACDKSPYPGYEMSENGVYSKFYTKNEGGQKAKIGDIVKISLVYKNSKDSALFDSRKNNPSRTNFIQFPLSKPTFKGSFEEALTMMSVGDSASFKISADSVYLITFKAKSLPPYVEKGSMLTFEAKLEKIITKDEEPKLMAKYIQDNNIAVAPTASGMYYIEKVKGNGPKPEPGSKVKVNYTGRLLDGTVFDTSDEAVAKQTGIFDERRKPYEPIEFELGRGQVIPGWDEGISMMNAGTKAQFIIPSALAYGESGSGPIPAYSPLVFDVELVSFSPAPVAPAAKK
jgi:FKBP-type peptidyl-prolyl cis-trans isomerase FkpA